jgi:hypothetical protein
MKRKEPDRLLGWYRENGIAQPMNCSLYEFIYKHWPNLPHSDEEKADYVARCREIIKQVRAIDAESGGDKNRLKPLSDEARNMVHEIPDRIPAGGFPNIDALEYDTTLSGEEIEARLLAELTRRELLDWFHFDGEQCL